MYVNVLLLNHRMSVRHNDDRPAYPAPVRRDVHSLVVMVDEYAHEFTNASCATKASEVGNEARRKPGEPDYGAIHVHHKSVRAVDFDSRGLADICSIRKLSPGPCAHKYHM